MSQATLHHHTRPIQSEPPPAPAVGVAVRGDRPRDAARGPRPDDPRHRAARHRRRPREPHRRVVGRDGLRRRRGRHHAPVGQARRPHRAQAPARGRAARLRPRVGAVRHGPGHHAADRPARRPGCGRRRPDDARDGRRRRSRRAARARPLPGLHRRHLRRGDHRRSADRRRARRPRELALGLPRQPADRRRRARRAAPAPAGAGRRRRRPPAGRGGRRAAGRRDHRPDADLHLGRIALRVGLGARSSP